MHSMLSLQCPCYCRSRTSLLYHMISLLSSKSQPIWRLKNNHKMLQKLTKTKKSFGY